MTSVFDFPTCYQDTIANYASQNKTYNYDPYCQCYIQAFT